MSEFLAQRKARHCQESNKRFFKNKILDLNKEYFVKNKYTLLTSILTNVLHTNKLDQLFEQ